MLITFLFHLFTNASAPVMHGVFRLLGLDRSTWNPLVPFMNLLLSSAVIFLLGLIGTNILGRRLLHMVDALILRLPLVRRVYGTVKHVVDTFQGPHRSFQRVVLIEYPRKGLWTMGLVAAERGDTLHLTPSPSVLTVYIPTTPNPTSGILVMVAAEDVMDVEYSIEEALTFVVSFGIVGKPLQRSSSSPATPPRPRPPTPPQPTRTGRNTVILRPCASWTSGRGWGPETSAALPRRSSRVEPPAHCLYTKTSSVFPLLTSGPQGPTGERRRALRARA